MLQYVDALFAFATALGSPDLSLTDPAVQAAIVTIAEDPAPAVGSTIVADAGAGACSSWAARVGRPTAVAALMREPDAGDAWQCVAATFGQDALTGEACDGAAASALEPDLARWFAVAALVCDRADR